ncbi:ORF6N domain-containing protein [Symbiopectobacterium sp. RP]
MTKIITIQNTQLPVIEYQGQRVITTELLAQGYGAEVDSVRQNFKRNKNRFIEGKHYFKVEG